MARVVLLAIFAAFAPLLLLGALFSLVVTLLIPPALVYGVAFVALTLVFSAILWRLCPALFGLASSLDLPFRRCREAGGTLLVAGAHTGALIGRIGSKRRIARSVVLVRFADLGSGSLAWPSHFCRKAAEMRRQRLVRGR
jgi:hypothetical protein